MTPEKEHSELSGPRNVSFMGKVQGKPCELQRLCNLEESISQTRQRRAEREKYKEWGQTPKDGEGTVRATTDTALQAWNTEMRSPCRTGDRGDAPSVHCL